MISTPAPSLIIRARTSARHAASDHAAVGLDLDL
jgi:hypothetical protein